MRIQGAPEGPCSRHAKTGLGALLTVKNALDQVFVATRLPDGIHTAGFRQVNVGLRWDHR